MLPRVTAKKKRASFFFDSKKLTINFYLDKHRRRNTRTRVSAKLQRTTNKQPSSKEIAAKERIPKWWKLLSRTPLMMVRSDEELRRGSRRVALIFEMRLLLLSVSKHRIITTSRASFLSLLLLFSLLLQFIILSYIRCYVWLAGCFYFGAAFLFVWIY